MEFIDPLGFTRETASLLTGLGANLTEFKKRNIGLEDLKYLTKPDLHILDVGDNFDYSSFEQLCINLKRKRDTSKKTRCADVTKILGSEHRQLKVIEIYLKTLQLQMMKNKMDYFIDQNKNLRISEALVIASKSVMKEIELLEKALEYIQSKKPESNNTNKNKYVLLVGGIGISLTLIYIYRKTVS